MYLTSTLARPQGQEEKCLEGQMLQGGLFNWFKMNLVSWCKNQGEIPGGDTLPAFGSVSVETIQETSEIFILTDIDGRTINGAGLQLPVLKQVHKEVSN